MDGIGGVLKGEPEHFVVHELPATTPSGTGDHLWIEVEKRHLSTPQLIRALADLSGLQTAAIGSAGRKDKIAITRQWLSLEAGATAQLPGDGQWIESEDGAWQIRQRSPHERRLRTGHLRGNRFEVLVTGLQPEGLERADALHDALRGTGWMPNPYGQQRFLRPESLARARRLLARGQRGRSHRDRFDYSVLQAAFFNHYMKIRNWPDPLVVPGEWYQTERGGIFTDEDEVAVRNRLEKREICPCGPLPGGKLRKPGDQALAWMAEVGEILGTGTQDWQRLGKRIPGAWRPLVIPAPRLELERESRGLWLRFEMPAGSYATVLLNYFQTGAWELACPL